MGHLFRAMITRMPNFSGPAKSRTNWLPAVAAGIFCLASLSGCFTGTATGQIPTRQSPTPAPSPSPSSQNLLQNGSFESGIAPWRFKVSSGASGDVRLDPQSEVDGGSSVRVNVGQAYPCSPWYVQFSQGDLAVHQGDAAILSFVARASSLTSVQVVLQHEAPPYTPYFHQSATLTNDWQKYSLRYTPLQSDAAVLLAFNLAHSAGQIWLAHITLVQTQQAQSAGGTTGPADLTSGTPAPPYDLQPAQARTQWKMVWDDEFNGTSIDTTKWMDDPGAFPNCAFDFGLQSWSAQDVSVQNGALRITSEKRAGSEGYTSGVISTFDLFAFQYGRVDIRARLPRTQGLWPAFWLLPASQHISRLADYEIDMMELLGHAPRTVYMTNNWGQSSRQCSYTGPVFSNDYHVFSVIWEPNSITWYIDGLQRCQVTQGVSNEAMYLIIDTAVGGSWPGPPNATTAWPQHTDVDYVRVYQER